MSLATPSVKRHQVSRPLIGLAAFFGAALACTFDIIQKEKAAATIVMSTKLQAVGIPYIPPAITILVICIAASCICFYDEVTKPRAAFKLGLGILSVFMTAVPYKEPDSLPTSAAVEQHQEKTGALFSLFTTNAYAVEFPQLSIKAEIVVVNSGKGTIPNSTLSITDEQGNAVGQSKSANGHFVFYLKPGNYKYRVEAPGYSIFTSNLKIDNTAQFYRVTMGKSSMPLTVQRLFG